MEPADTPEQPTNTVLPGLASVLSGEQIQCLTTPVAMETIRTEQEGKGGWVGTPGTQIQAGWGMQQGRPSWPI